MSKNVDFLYWNMPAETLLHTLGSDQAGLTTDAAQQRLLDHGLNQLKATTQRAAWQLFFGQFKNPIVLILLFATAISALLADWMEALIIFLIVLGSAFLSFLQEYGAGNGIEKLRARVATKTTIFRDGEPVALPVEQVVPGDVVLLAAGSLIPADGVVLDAKDFYVNQAVLTGETFPVQKQPGVVPADAILPERTNAVLMGSNVRSGNATVLIVATGAATEFGQVAHRLLVRPPETDFERGIRRFGYLLSEIMFVLVLIVFAVNIYLAEPVLDSLLFSIALAVGLTPQLLPAIISLTLAKGARLMAANGVIVRRLEAIENFGSMDILCTDKTGTITEGVVQLDGALDAIGCPSDTLFRYAYLNAYFETGLANPLDEAITAHRQLDIEDVQKLDEIPYDFVRKRLSIVVQSTQSPEAAPLLITKGALDNILAVCTQVQVGETVVTLDADQLAAVQQRYVAWSELGYRVLGVATKLLPRQAAYERDVETGLIFQGFLLFLDPPKANVRETVADLAALGVLILLVVRTRKPFFHSRPGNGLLIAGLLIGAVTLVLPYSPLSMLLGFAPLSISVLLALAGITLLHVAASEIAKHYFYRYARG
ncbi:MAG TPA: HAD-IC family P-type ATPase [Caldilineaceae bacterium]|nr:HAD-IC family P-type ATPase [Caldilineaceae bacterium]